VDEEHPVNKTEDYYTRDADAYCCSIVIIAG